MVCQCKGQRVSLGFGDAERALSGQLPERPDRGRDLVTHCELSQ